MNDDWAQTVTCVSVLSRQAWEEVKSVQEGKEPAIFLISAQGIIQTLFYDDVRYYAGCNVTWRNGNKWSFLLDVDGTGLRKIMCLKNKQKGVNIRVTTAFSSNRRVRAKFNVGLDLQRKFSPTSISVSINFQRIFSSLLSRKLMTGKL